jgi:hypothetical protein
VVLFLLLLLLLLLLVVCSSQIEVGIFRLIQWLFSM